MGLLGWCVFIGFGGVGIISKAGRTECCTNCVRCSNRFVGMHLPGSYLVRGSKRYILVAGDSDRMRIVRLLGDPNNETGL